MCVVCLIRFSGENLLVEEYEVNLMMRQEVIKISEMRVTMCSDKTVNGILGGVSCNIMCTVPREDTWRAP